MLRTKVALVLVVIFFTTLALVSHLVFISEHDREKYHSLITSSQASSPTVHHLGSQKRQKVQKDYWSEDATGNILHFVLSYGDSELSISYGDATSTLVETMHDVTIAMQEELYYKLPDGREALKQNNGLLLIRNGDPNDPLMWISDDSPGVVPMQQIRYLESDEAVYCYNSNLFDAQRATFSVVTAPGHEIAPQSAQFPPLMEGIAQTMQCTLDNESLHFNAHHIQMKVYSTTRGGVS